MFAWDEVCAVIAMEDLGIVVGQKAPVECPAMHRPEVQRKHWRLAHTRAKELPHPSFLEVFDKRVLVRIEFVEHPTERVYYIIWWKEGQGPKVAHTHAERSVLVVLLRQSKLLQVSMIGLFEMEVAPPQIDAFEDSACGFVARLRADRKTTRHT